jgi:ribosomal-protein-alanine N-acetyltransferase
MSAQPVLETERLLLRPFHLSDAKEVRHLAGDRSIADTTINIPHPYEDGMAEEWISTHGPKFEKGAAADFAIVLRDSGHLVGTISLQIERRFDHAELGYWVGKPYWSRGYCTEAAREILRYGFEDLKLNRIFACYFSRNPASGRIMEKLAMRHEGIARGHVKKWDKYEDLVMYAILKDQWLAIRDQA